MLFFIRGFIIGLSIAAVVGPICLLCIHRTLDRGFLYGLVSGLGAATADAIYGSIAAFGLTLIASFLVSQSAWIHLLGGAFLIYLGLKTVLSRPAESAAKAEANNYTGAYASTVLLTLTNPSTILSFAAIFAGLGVGASRNDILAAVFVVCGVFLGSSLWWLILSSGINLLRRKFNELWLLWVNRASGGCIIIFGVLALVSLRA
jgi:threonine/homoserine/homoserine lactone efflux protein